METRIAKNFQFLNCVVCSFRMLTYHNVTVTQNI